DNALFEAFLNKQGEIEGKMIDQIADNLGLEPNRAPQPSAPLPIPTVPGFAPAMTPAPPSIAPVRPSAPSPVPPQVAPAGPMPAVARAVPPVPPAVQILPPPPPADAVNQAGEATSKPAKSNVDLAEIDRYLEGLGKL